MISVIMPVYNVERYVSTCIKSVLNQTYRNFELIIVNDGSTDNSLKEIEKFNSDPRVRIITQVNQGLSSARNTGLKYVKGEYTYFIDSDDIINHNLFKLLIMEFKANKAIDLISFDHVESNLKKIPNMDENLNVKRKNFLSAGEALKELMKNEIDQMAWSYIVRTEILIRNNIQFSYGRLFEDNNSAAKIFNNCKKIEKISVFPKPYILRERESSITERANSNLSIKELKDEMFIFKDEFDVFIESNNVDANLAQRWYFNKLNHLYIKYYSSLITEAPTLLNDLRQTSIKMYHNHMILSLSFRDMERWLRVNSKVFDRFIRFIVDRRKDE
ncbi:glycosyltransferase family 2 protein [Weissella confusa]|uniref:Glycosyltransferase family 2 protein n=1 Tax=Limosilactobacillus reuteri TaxID=1598 RepID=A0A2T5Q1B9_LIMRT|nr:glycosyltransferase family 2 protein [Limosilactobacillus reuteri]MCW3764653.1 glycosyltransferase family 2 protein [Weissella confusa]PTV01203.1 glycosyltransferase family 2 protein [Limosilactobacillus reuteri]